MLCLFRGHAANFSANPISTVGGCWGFGFQSQPGTGLICSCCDFVPHKLKRTHTWPMICGPWQPKPPPECVCAFVCGCLLSVSGRYRANSFTKYLQNIWMCWQDQACDWTTRPPMTGLSERWRGRGISQFNNKHNYSPNDWYTCLICCSIILT